MCNAGPKGPKGQTGAKYMIVSKQVADIVSKMFWVEQLPRKNGYVTISQNRIAEYLKQMFHVKQ